MRLKPTKSLSYTMPKTRNRLLQPDGCYNPQTEEVINFYFFLGGGGTLRPLILCIKTSVTVSKVYLLTDDFSMEQKRFLSVR